MINAVSFASLILLNVIETHTKSRRYLRRVRDAKIVDESTDQIIIEYKNIFRSNCEWGLGRLGRLENM